MTKIDVAGAIEHMNEQASLPGWRHVVEDHVDDGTPRPLDGVRVLAVEQMQALPFATQLLGRLGADVVKIEHPEGGDMGRGSAPSIPDADGEPMGATFLRNNLGKRSITLDLKSPAGVELFRSLVPTFDIVAQNLKTGAMDRLGLGYDDLATTHPALCDLIDTLVAIATAAGTDLNNDTFGAALDTIGGLPLATVPFASGAAGKYGLSDTAFPVRYDSALLLWALDGDPIDTSS